MTELVIATGNPGKLKEFEGLLAGHGLVLSACETGVAETADTYAGNAILKAAAASAATGQAALGDDSGFEVEALGGEPGLYSARLAPTQAERNRIVLSRLASVPRPWRARFVCVVALAAPGRPTRTFEGICEGEVVAPRDGGHGFGYDPLLLVPEVGKTFAEMAPVEKHRWSHRGAAVRALLASGTLDGV